jgi:hypothetical protein
LTLGQLRRWVHLKADITASKCRSRSNQGVLHDRKEPPVAPVFQWFFYGQPFRNARVNP